MANYVQQTDFSTKDSLPSGDPEKKIQGSDMDGEFEAIATAISTKQDSSGRGQANGYASLGTDGEVPAAQLPDASTDAPGIVELATDAEAAAAESTTVALTPANIPSIGISLTAASGTLPISKGGTGATSAGAALLQNLGLYSGSVEFDGGSGVIETMMPTGWSATRLSQGGYSIVHNLGTTNYKVVATPNRQAADRHVVTCVKFTNSFTLYAHDTEGIARDSDFDFFVIKH